MAALIATPQTLQDDSWYADSGASNHLTPEADKINNKTDYMGKEHMIIGDGSSLKIAHIGTGFLDTTYSSPLLLNDLLHVPTITKNLISVSKLTSDNNVSIEFFPHFCSVKDLETGKEVLRGTLEGGLYRLDPIPSKKHVYATHLSQTQSSQPSRTQSIVDIWHKRLGHPSKNILSLVLKQSNINANVNETLSFCDACQFGKAHALPFPTSHSQAQHVLDLIHTDLWGPSPIASHTNYRYYIHFLDDYSRFTWLYPLKHKSEALAAFIQFKQLVENQFDRKIKQLRTDWGGEFQAFTQLVSDNGIFFHHSCPYTSEQNGRAERKHRHIVETGLTLLAQAQMPLKYWSDAFQTSVYLINRLPSSVLQNRSPFEVLFSKTPDYMFLKTFGVSCFPCIRPYQKHKFEFHSVKCVNLGYSEVHKGYKCLSPHGRIYITRHVIFNEKEFPFSTGFLNTKQPEQYVTLTTPHSWFTLPFASSLPSSTSSPVAPV